MSYDGSHHYTYDAEGKMLQVDSGSTVIFTYDALDHKVRWQTPSAASENLFDSQGRLTSGWTPNNGNTAGTATEAHIFADNTQIAFRSGDGKTYFIHRNWLETDRVHTDMNGATGATFTSLPFGDGGSANVSESYAGWDFNHFAGLDIDWSSNTYPAQYRTYSQAQARWLSPDPYDGSYDASNPQSFNRYAYVLNNPLSYTDKLGLDCDDDNGTWDANGNVDGGCYPGGIEGCWWCMEYGWPPSGPSTPYYPPNPPSKPKTPPPAPPVVAPSKLACRVKQGITGATNLAIAGAKTGGLIAADGLLAAATPFTGGASAVVAAAGTVYGVTSIGGQVIAGAGQLYTA